MRPTKEDLVMFGMMKIEDLQSEITDYDQDYAKRHGLTLEEMKDFKEDMIIEEEITRLYYELSEKYDAKPHFAW